LKCYHSKYAHVHVTININRRKNLLLCVSSWSVDAVHFKQTHSTQLHAIKHHRCYGNGMITSVAMQYMEFNAGNFQEYDYECEWIECDWKSVHGTTHLVTAYKNFVENNSSTS
jgi:hypothetical protein